MATECGGPAMHPRRSVGLQRLGQRRYYAVYALDADALRGCGRVRFVDRVGRRRRGAVVVWLPSLRLRHTPRAAWGRCCGPATEGWGRRQGILPGHSWASVAGGRGSGLSSVRASVPHDRGHWNIASSEKAARSRKVRPRAAAPLGPLRGDMGPPVPQGWPGFGKCPEAGGGAAATDEGGLGRRHCYAVCDFMAVCFGTA